METTERIVESYYRHVHHCLTIANVKCGGQQEIDLLAVQFGRRGVKRRLHVETSVSISTGFSKLTNKPYDEQAAKLRVQASGQRRTLGFFHEKKFGSQHVLDKLIDYGFKDGNYSRVIVTWDADDDVVEAARVDGMEVVKMTDMLREIAEATASVRTYYADDTIRTLQLMAKAEDAWRKSTQGAS